jgi:hypothetical protein
LLIEKLREIALLIEIKDEMEINFNTNISFIEKLLLKMTLELY